MGYSPGSCKESDSTAHTHTHASSWICHLKCEQSLRYRAEQSSSAAGPWVSLQHERTQVGSQSWAIVTGRLPDHWQVTYASVFSSMNPADKARRLLCYEIIPCHLPFLLGQQNLCNILFHLVSGQSALISHASKVMLKILQARLQLSVNQELPDVQDWFRKGRGTRDQIANICWIIGKTKEFQKNTYFCFIDYSKTFDCGILQTVENSQEMEIANHPTYLLQNLYADQEAIVRIGYGTMDWFKIGNGVCQGCILSPCLLNLYAT